MKKLLSLLFGCTEAKPTVKKRKASQVGMTQKDWQREDAHLAWINRMAFTSMNGRRLPAPQPKRKTQLEISDPLYPTYKILGLVK